MTFRAEFEHREELLRCAIDEFCERGYGAASLNRILSTSGMSKGQLYHHFANKEALYLALVEWIIDRKIAWFMDHPVAPAEDFFDLLGAQIRASLEFASQHPEVDRLGRALLAERGRPIFAAVTQRFAFDPEGILGAMVTGFYEQGQFRRDLSLGFVQRAVLLAVNHAPDLLDLTPESDLRGDVDELITFLRAGLRPAEAPLRS